MPWKIFNEGKDITLRVNNGQLEWQYVGSSTWTVLTLTSELGAIIESVNGKTGIVVIDPDDLDDSSTTHKFITQALLDQIDSNTVAITGKEDSLGNPDVDGKFLSSLADGTRSWTTVDTSDKEGSLGNPSEDGQVLSSLADGTRSWITVTVDTSDKISYPNESLVNSPSVFTYQSFNDVNGILYAIATEGGTPWANPFASQKIKAYLYNTSNWGSPTIYSHTNSNYQKTFDRVLGGYGDGISITYLSGVTQFFVLDLMEDNFWKPSKIALRNTSQGTVNYRLYATNNISSFTDIKNTYLGEWQCYYGTQNNVITVQETNNFFRYFVIEIEASDNFSTNINEIELYGEANIPNPNYTLDLVADKAQVKYINRTKNINIGEQAVDIGWFCYLRIDAGGSFTLVPQGSVSIEDNGYGLTQTVENTLWKLENSDGTNTGWRLWLLSGELSSSTGHTIQDEGTPLTNRTNLDFVGDNVTVTDDSENDKTIVTITGGSGGGLTYSYQSTSFNAINGNSYGVNTTSGIITATLPASPNDGDVVAFSDAASTFGTNNLLIDGNGNNIAGYSTITLTGNNESVQLRYSSTASQWMIEEAVYQGG